MEKLPILSGKELLRILCNEFGFSIARIEGDHFIVKGLRNGRLKTFPVPSYREIGRKLFSRILKEAEISKEDFAKAYFKR